MGAYGSIQDYVAVVELVKKLASLLQVYSNFVIGILNILLLNVNTKLFWAT